MLAMNAPGHSTLASACPIGPASRVASEYPKASSAVGDGDNGTGALGESYDTSRPTPTTLIPNPASSVLLSLARTAGPATPPARRTAMRIGSFFATPPRDS